MICSFCTKDNKVVEFMFAGPSVAICSECCDLCTDILSEKRTSENAGLIEYQSWLQHDKEQSKDVQMNVHEMAAALDGRQYGQETTKADELAAEEGGLVIVFGASDDLMEFRGAVNDEIGAWEGATAYFTTTGLLTNDCDNERCPHFKKLAKTAATIDAKWDVEGYSWVYETAIPHATFDVLEDDHKYSRGIVFALADAKQR